MKKFYTLSLSHKIFNDFQDVFVFPDLERFCYFSELFHLNDMWDVSYNSNTNDVREYIQICNTDTNMMFVEYEEGLYETIEQYKKYYNSSVKEFTTSVFDYLTEIDNYEKDSDFDFENDEDEEHKIFFSDGSYKPYYSIDSLQSNILDIKNKDSELINFIKIKINPYKVSFDEYIKTMMIFDDKIYFPPEVINIETLNHFLNAVSDFSMIEEYLKEYLKNEKVTKK